MQHSVFTRSLLEMNKKERSELLYDVQRKARLAKEVTQTAGYIDFQDWVQQTTQQGAPTITGLDSLIAYVARSLINEGIRTAGGYFQNVCNNDLPLLEKAIEEIEQELEAEQQEYGAAIDPLS